MAAIPSKGAESVAQLYYDYKHNIVTSIAGVNKSMVTPLDLATYVIQSFYDGDTGQGQRADLIQAIATAIGLYKGTV